MASKAKAKGTSFESAVAKYFKEHGFIDIRRVALTGGLGKDNGDLAIGATGGNSNIPEFVIECKNYAKELPYKMIEDFYTRSAY